MDDLVNNILPEFTSGIKFISDSMIHNTKKLGSMKVDPTKYIGQFWVHNYYDKISPEVDTPSDFKLTNVFTNVDEVINYDNYTQSSMFHGRAWIARSLVQHITICDGLEYNIDPEDKFLKDPSWSPTEDEFGNNGHAILMYIDLT